MPIPQRKQLLKERRKERKKNSLNCHFYYFLLAFKFLLLFILIHSPRCAIKENDNDDKNIPVFFLLFKILFVYLFIIQILYIVLEGKAEIIFNFHMNAGK